jgi:tape measure domain-containing protein
MAVEVERMILRLEANLARYEKEMKRAADLTSRRMSQIERSARQGSRGVDRDMRRAAESTRRAARDMERESRRAARGIERPFMGLQGRIGGALAAAFSAQQIVEFADSFTRINNTLKVAGLEADALKATYEDLFDIAQRNAAPFEELTTLYGRLAQAQTALGATQGQLLQFTEGVAQALIIQGASAQQARGALLQLTQAVAGGVVRAEEFNSVNEGARPILQAVANGLEEAGGSVARLRQLVLEGKVSSEAFFNAFLAGSQGLAEQAGRAQLTVGLAFNRVKTSITNLIGVVDQSSGASAALADQLGSVASGLDAVAAAAPAAIAQLGSYISQLERLSGIEVNSLGSLGQALGGATRQAILSPTQPRSPFDELRRAETRLADPDLSRGQRQRFERLAQSAREAIGALEAERELTRELGRAGFASRPLASRAPAAAAEPAPIETVSLADFPVDGETAGGGRRGGAGKRENALEREIEQIQRRTEALRLDAEVIGLSQFESDRLHATTELLNAAREAGVTITPQLEQQVNQLSTAYAQQAEQVRALEEAQRAMEQVSGMVADGLTDVFEGLITGSKNAQEAIAGLLSQLGRLLINRAFNSLIGGLFGGGGGGIFGALFGRAAGGPVDAGKAVRVGEFGPETFVPTTPGRIIPADRAQPAQAAPQITYQIDARGAQMGVADQITAALHQYDQRVLPGSLARIQKRTG